MLLAYGLSLKCLIKLLLHVYCLQRIGDDIDVLRISLVSSPMAIPL